MRAVLLYGYILPVTLGSMPTVEFDWDPKKDPENQAKHGVAFETVWSSPPNRNFGAYKHFCGSLNRIIFAYGRFMLAWMPAAASPARFLASGSHFEPAA